ncbi:MAG: peptide chain release factor N(5)-glutamine methyltransferase [Cyanobacteriota bacterium]|nr:peptide chain release factor N(5)-glutamine methyltransferase [Cyanobacteriota bacterium]
MTDEPILGDAISPPLHCVSGTVLWQWRVEAQRDAIAINIDSTEVDWFLQALSQLDRLSLKLGSFRERDRIAIQIPFEELQRRWQQRIERRVPLQYLVGIAPWRNFELAVSPAVLIPRPETEELVEIARQACLTDGFDRGHWVDLGTGSGAIALGLAVALPDTTIHAVDRSTAALEIARDNARQLGLLDRVKFYAGNWFTPLEALKGTISGTISNPPYIPTAEIERLQPEVRQHEPHLALDGGPDGLDCIRHIVETAPDYLQPGGFWAIEMMAGQAEAVTDLLQQNGNYDRIRVHRDLSGLDRFVSAQVK